MIQKFSELALSGQLTDRSTTLTIALSNAMPTPLPNATRAAPDPSAWAALTDLAHRTYAPATEESRRLGAGAGLSDND